MINVALLSLDGGVSLEAHAVPKEYQAPIGYQEKNSHPGKQITCQVALFPVLKTRGFRG
jgi:hypothetical protein